MKTFLNGTLNEGLFEKGAFLKYEEEVTKYNATKDFIAQKIMFAEYILQVIPQISGYKVIE